MAVEVAARLAVTEAVDAVARVAIARRPRLLRAYRRHLCVEDLEDTYSQATLELIARAQRDGAFASESHISHSLEQKFESRVIDRVRALSGRSPREALRAPRVDVDEIDPTVDEERDALLEAVAARQELARLREVADELTDNERLVLACQIGLGMQSAEFCARFGWSAEKYKKTAQRGRARLRQKCLEYDAGERCRTLATALLAYVGKDADEPQTEKVEIHLRNCAGCRALARELERTQAGLAILLPLPAMASVGLIAKLGAVGAGLKRFVSGLHDDGGVVTGASGATVAAGGSAAGVGALKAGVAALCVGGAVGGYSVCKEAGLFAPVQPPERRVIASKDKPAAKDRGGPPRSVARPAATIGLKRPAPAPNPRPVKPSGAGGHDAQVEREFGRRQPKASTAQATSEFQRPARAASSAPKASSAPPAEPEPMPSGSGSTGEFGFE